MCIYLYLHLEVGHWRHTYGNKITQRATTGSVWTPEEWCHHLKNLLQSSFISEKSSEITQELKESNPAFKLFP